MGSGAAIVRNTRHPPLLNRCPSSRQIWLYQLFQRALRYQHPMTLTRRDPELQTKLGCSVILESICGAYIIGVICVARLAQVAMAT